MQVYRTAVKLTGLAVVSFVLIIPVSIVSSELGFDPALGFVIFGLFALYFNLRIYNLSCPNCGKNLFRRGIFYYPWPNRVCRKCGTDLAAK